MRVLPRSLFGRLVVVQVAVALLLAALLPLLISHWLISTTNAFVARGLDRSAGRLKGSISYGPDGWSVRRKPRPTFDSRGGIRNVRVIDGAGRTWVNQGPDYRIPASELPIHQANTHRLWNGIDVAAYPIQSNGHRAWLVISSDRRRPETLVANVATTFLHRFLWIVPALIVSSLMLTLVFLSQGIRAIRRVSKKADDIDADSLGMRLDVEALPLEVQPLARAMNGALDRVQDSYAAQSEFAANVAHELRTPLATIACRIEEITDPLLRDRMSVSVNHAAHVVDQLMMLARVGGEAPVLARIDLRSVTLQALEQAAPGILMKGRTVEFEDMATGADLIVEGNDGLTRLSLDNLLDNAQRHTPLGTCIKVSLGPGPHLVVEDDGPGIPAIDLNRVRDRHWRANDRSSEGAGLGLSIVSKAMRAQQGSLEILESGDGAKFALNFVQFSSPRPAPPLLSPADARLAPISERVEFEPEEEEVSTAVLSTI